MKYFTFDSLLKCFYFSMEVKNETVLYLLYNRSERWISCGDPAGKNAPSSGVSFAYKLCLDGVFTGKNHLSVVTPLLPLHSTDMRYYGWYARATKRQWRR